MIRNRLTRPSLVLNAVVLLALFALPLFGQGGSGVIRGRVTEAGGNALADVQLSVTGTTFGAITGANGTYTISNVPSGNHEVVARRIGYGRGVQRVAVTTGGDVRADFQLSPAASQLEAVVVTGTAGAVEKRTVGNAITQLDVADITRKTNVETVTEVLQAKTPGVTISPGSGTPGTASDIVIRGYSSFTANRPVVYIDGVRMNTDSLYNFTPSGSGASPFTGQRTSALDLVNPDDIESIEVIRGPAASTLYGADAAAGVIQIITKKGQRGQQANRWSVRAEGGHNEWGGRPLVNYMTCTAALKAAVDAAGTPLWGGANGSSGCLTVPDNTVITDRPFERDPTAMRTGNLYSFGMSLRGGGDHYSYYLSGDTRQDEGILLNSYHANKGLRTNFSFTPSAKADFSVSLGYLHDNLRLPLGDEAANGLLLSAARGQPGRTVAKDANGNFIAAQYGWRTSYPAQENKYNNRTKTDRFTVGTTVNYSPLTWFRNRATVGMDYNQGFAQVLSLPGEIDVPLGFVAQRVPRIYNYTIDYSGTVTRNIGSNVESSSSIGAQLTSSRTELLSATGSQLPPGGISTIGSAVTTTGSNTFSEFNSVGEYVQEQLAFRNRLYITGAIRGDAHSSFGANASYIRYPKASLSYVMSEEPRLRGLFDRLRTDNFRFRAAWGRAGRAPQPFFANPTYASDRVALGANVASALRTGTFGNPNLRPERGTEVEAGIDADFLKSRVGIEVTHYDKTMRDLIIPLTVPASLGYSSTQLTNIGKTRNHGTELAVTGTPLELGAVTWDARITASWNRNKLVTLDPNRTEAILDGLSYTPGLQRNKVGYPLGAFIVQMPAKDASGNYVFANTGRTQLLLETDTLGPGQIVPHFTFIGTPTPKRQVSLGNTITLFRNWRLYALFDHQGNYYQVNYKEYNRCALQSPAVCKLENDPGADTTLKRVMAASGASSALPLYIQKADFVKLRDLSLTFTVPTSLAQRANVQAASITIAGHNLHTWTDYNGLDPEVNEYSNATNRGVSQFGRADAYSMPQTRRLSLTFNLTY